MRVPVTMPKVDYDMESGKVIAWLKHEGDVVAKGEALASIETAKVVVDLESPVSGKVAVLAAAEGDEVAVGQLVAEIESEVEG